MSSPTNPSLLGSSPVPWRVDLVKTQLVDAEGKLIADFHPPGIRTEAQLDQSRANAALCARLMVLLVSLPDVS